MAKTKKSGSRAKTARTTRNTKKNNVKKFERLAAIAGASWLLTALVVMGLTSAATLAFGYYRGHHHKHFKTTVVRPDDLALPPDATTIQKNWYFWDDTNDTGDTNETPGSYEFSKEAGGSKGEGAVRMQTNAASERWNITTNQFAGLDLSKLKNLSFDMYTPSTSTGGTATTLFLNFDVDFDNTATGGYQGRLVYVPQQNGTPSLDTWETWDTLDDGNGVWWWSRYASSGNKWLDGSTDEYRTWDEVMTAFPNAEVLNETFTGQFLVRAGHPGPDGLIGFVDNVKVNYKTFDFEPAAPEKTSDCRNGGWIDYGFDSHKDCVKYVRSNNNYHHKHNKGFWHRFTSFWRG